MAQADNCPTRTLTFAPHAKLALSRGTCFKAPMPTGPVQLVIQRLGAQGDGIAEHEGQQVFVPLTLPGETVMLLIARRRSAATMVNAAAARFST
jgi:predicted RNA-binding protein with TRAM domain